MTLEKQATTLLLDNFIVLKEGELWKSPPRNKLKSKSDWKRRYFRLLQVENAKSYLSLFQGSAKKTKDSEKKYTGFCLVYWKSENQHMLKPLRVVHLRGCNIEDTGDAQWSEFFLDIFRLTADGRTFLLSAENSEVRKEWVNSLNEAVRLANADDNPVYQSVAEINKRQLNLSPSCSPKKEKEVVRSDSGHFSEAPKIPSDSDSPRSSINSTASCEYTVQELVDVSHNSFSGEFTNTQACITCSPAVSREECDHQNDVFYDDIDRDENDNIYVRMWTSPMSLSIPALPTFELPSAKMRVDADRRHTYDSPTRNPQEPVYNRRVLKQNNQSTKIPIYETLPTNSIGNAGRQYTPQHSMTCRLTEEREDGMKSFTNFSYYCANYCRRALHPTLPERLDGLPPLLPKTPRPSHPVVNGCMRSSLRRLSRFSDGNEESRVSSIMEQDEEDDYATIGSGSPKGSNKKELQMNRLFDQINHQCDHVFHIYDYATASDAVSMDRAKGVTVDRGSRVVEVPARKPVSRRSLTGTVGSERSLSQDSTCSNGNEKRTLMKSPSSQTELLWWLNGEDDASLTLPDDGAAKVQSSIEDFYYDYYS